MLRLERDRLGEVALQVGRALARDAVDQVERDVVEARGPGACRPRRGPGRGSARARASSRRCGWKLCAPSDTRSIPCSRSTEANSGVIVSGLASTVVSAASGRPSSRRASAARLGEGRRTAAEEDGLDLLRQQSRARARAPPAARRRSRRARRRGRDGDEIAVAAAMGAEGQVDVEVARAGPAPGMGVARPPSGTVRGNSSRMGDAVVPVACRSTTVTHLLRSSRLSTARNASCGTSTPPTCFIRFLPFFCFSSSFRLRLMSPP